MAYVGLSKPFYALYSASGTTVSYASGGSIAKAVSASISIDGKDPTVLYADNGPAESAGIFGGGTLTLGIDKLDLSVAAALLGITAPTSNSTPTPAIFGADAVAPYVGVGLVVKSIEGGSAVWRAVILYKVQFKLPDFDWTTQGDTIEFSTPELEAAILRDDSSTSKWASMQDFTSEADAVAAVKTALSIT